MLTPIQLDAGQKTELSDILVSSGWIADPTKLPLLLGRLPDDVRNSINNSQVPRVMAMSIVETCNQYEGAIERLVASLEQLAPRSTASAQAREFFDDLRVTANFDRSARAELVQILDRAAFEPAQLGHLVRKSAPYSFNEPPSNVSDAVRFLALLPKRLEGFGYPLIEFALRASHRATAAKVSQKLADWASTTAAARNVDGDLNTLEARINKEEAESAPSVTLILKEHEDDPQKFSAMMWLWSDDDEATSRPAVPENALSLEQVQKAVNDELRAICDDLQRLDIRFEVFVPNNMADYDFDSWNVQLGMVKAPRRLGELFPTTTRSLDRLLHGKPFNSRWRTKWKQVLAAAGGSALPPPVVFDSPCLPVDLRRDLAADDALMIGFCFVPRGTANLLMDEILEAGVPVGVWLRRSSVDPTLGKRIRSFLGSAPDELPRRLFNERKLESESGGFWYSLTVMWDDPDRVPHITNKLISPR
jgi:hypothetical protein